MSNWIGSLPLPPKKPDNEQSTRKTRGNTSSKSRSRSPPKERNAIAYDNSDPSRRSQAPPPPKPLAPAPPPPPAVKVQVPKKEPEVVKLVTPPPRPPTPPPTSPCTPPPLLPLATPPSPLSPAPPKRKVKKKPPPPEVKKKEPPPAFMVTYAQAENFDIEPTEKKPEDNMPLKINPIAKNLKLFQINFIPKSEGESYSDLASIGIAKAKSVEEQNKVAAADQELLEALAIDEVDPFNIPTQRTHPGTSANLHKNFGKFIDVLHMHGSDSESVSSWGSG